MLLAFLHGSGGAYGGDGIMNTRRFAIVAAALCGTVVLAGWVVARLPGFATASIENSGAVPIEDRAASLAANARLADEPQAIAMANAAVANAAGAAAAGAEILTAAEPVTGTATDTTAASDQPESIVVATLPDPPQMLPETPAPVTQDFRYLIYYVWSELPRSRRLSS